MVWITDTRGTPQKWNEVVGGPPRIKKFLGGAGPDALGEAPWSAYTKFGGMRLSDQYYSIAPAALTRSTLAAKGTKIHFVYQSELRYPKGHRLKPSHFLPFFPTFSSHLDRVDCIQL